MRHPLNAVGNACRRAFPVLALVLSLGAAGLFPAHASEAAAKPLPAETLTFLEKKKIETAAPVVMTAQLVVVSRRLRQILARETSARKKCTMAVVNSLARRR